MTDAEFVYSYHMRQPNEQQLETGARVFNIWCWKSNELDEYGDPKVSPCFTMNLLLPADALAEYNILDMQTFVGSKLAEKLKAALAAGAGDPLHDRIMKIRTPLS